VIKDFKPEEDDDLPLRVGEVVEFVEMLEDPDFIEVKNKSGQSGFVPLNRLEVSGYFVSLG
jgi:hypothetical protein